MANSFKLALLISCAGLCACAEEPMSDDTADIEEAAFLSALEVNEDGADEVLADATADQPTIERHGCFADLREQLRDRFDADGNGKLDRTERSALRDELGEGRGGKAQPMRKYKRKLLHHIYDSDQSGHLEENEREVSRADLKARCENRRAAVLRDYDADADGDLSVDEFAEFVKDKRAKFAAKHAAVVAKFDTDGDGRLNHDERQAARAALRGRCEERLEKLKDEYDTDGDGSLNADEREALIEYLRARVRGEHFDDA